FNSRPDLVSFSASNAFGDILVTVPDAQHTNLGELRIVTGYPDNGRLFSTNNIVNSTVSIASLPTFAVQTASPGDAPYGGDVVITEGGNPGLVTVTLSSPTDVPVNVHVNLAPSGYDSDVALSNIDFTIAPGQTIATFAVATGLIDNIVEPIENGILNFTATAQSTPLSSSSGNSSIPLLVKDQMTSPDGLSAIAA